MLYFCIVSILGIIPARYKSTRLLGKPLIDIVGKPMIQHVYERASQVLEHVYVATDDERISQVVESFGGRVVLTAENHVTGTNRCLEAYQKIVIQTTQKFTKIINIQGDEPLLALNHLTEIIGCFDNTNTEMATLALAVKDQAELENQSECFVVFDKNYNALYFSRAVIPFLQGVPFKDWLKKHIFYKHLGLYAYTPTGLDRFANLPQSVLEKTESLEQNRWLEFGNKLKIAITKTDSFCVDTFEDLKKVRAVFEKQNK